MLLLLLEMLVVGGLILALYSLRNRFGLALLFIFVGSNQFIQNLMVVSVYVEMGGRYPVSPGSAVLFSSSLLALLLIYLKEDIPTARRLIYGIILANVTLALIVSGTRWAIQLGAMTEIRPLADWFMQYDLRMFGIGVTLLFVDLLLLLIVFEFLRSKARWLPLWGLIVASLCSVLSLDTVLFVLLAFPAQAESGDLLTGGLLGKNLAGVIYGSLLWMYLSLGRDDAARPRDLRDPFSIFTYRERYQRLKAEKEEMEEASRREQRRSQIALRGAGLGLWDWNLATGDTFLDDRWAAMLGYTVDEIQPVIASWRSRIHPEDLPAVDKALSEHLEGSSPQYQVEHRLRTKAGEWKWVLTLGQVLERDAQGKPLQMSGAHLDIEERKQAEFALRQLVQEVQERGSQLAASEARFRSLVENVPGAIFRAAPGGNDLHFVSPAIEHITGYDMESFLSSDSRLWREMIHPDDRRRVRTTVELALLESSTWVVEYRIRDAAGEQHWLLEKGRGTCRETGEILWLDGAVFDITEQKQAEDEKARLARKLRETQALESLGLLAGGIAHDFNNLLTTVLGNADLALQQLDPAAPARQALKDIARSAERAADLAQQMLAYSGRGTLSVELINLSELILEIAGLLKASMSAKVSVSYDLAPDLPPIEGDVTQIRQIIINLITNASEALGDAGGTIRISTGVRTLDRGDPSPTGFGIDSLEVGTYVVLRVEDSGCGMDARTRRRIFEPFYTSKGSGRGLGLSVVQGIVRSHRGAIEVESAADAGTTFTLLLPATDAVPAPPVQPTGEAPSLRRGSLALVADDEDAVRQVARRMLERLGYKVMTARDGRHALELFKQHSTVIELVILDLTMPELSGEQVLEEIRHLDPDLPVLLSSGFSEEEFTSRLARDAAVGFLQKPYRLKTLEQSIRRVVEQGFGTSAGR